MSIENELSAVAVGIELPARTYTITRADLVRYAGASGDFNPIHWNDRTAVRMGLPGVIAHGMLTMALAGRAVTDWTGDPGAIEEYGAKFTAMVEVPDDDTGTTLTVTGRIVDISETRRARVDLTVTVGETKVLGRARALVRLPNA